MDNENTQGVWIRSNKTLYVLETGTIAVHNSIDRLRNILVQRDLIDYTKDNSRISGPAYVTMSIKQANENGYPVETIYITEHVRKTFENKKSTEEDGWFKKS